MNYRFLDEDGRTSRKSVADALDVLSPLPYFETSFQGLIRVRPFFGPVGLVHLEWTLEQDLTASVGLPSCVGFRCTTHAGEVRELDAQALDGAVVTSAGGITLLDGTELIGADVISAEMHDALSDTEYRILWHLVTWAGREHDCIRSLRKGLSLEVQKDKKIPDIRWFDFAKLLEIEPPPLKVFEGYIEQHSWCAYPRRPGEITKPSQQKIADTLRKCGIRNPIARPRVTRRLFA